MRKNAQFIVKFQVKTSEQQIFTPHIQAVLGIHLEFLWKDKFGTDDGVLRRGDTGKWFAAILTCRMKTLTGKGEGTLEVINLRVDPKSIGEIVDNIRIFRAYHMNKKHWISIVLDGGVCDHEIYARIDESYRLAVK